ncbi:hypothetical protein LSH36_275g08005 [Paralvinella palmiformis]|uniref:Dynamin-binding protein n=1 Tax=Paralvinella palmiformis TaxID=53620 RepID=A0AAD9JKJ7_9ANNE|nr:hypothetical protein LSH36_275g08005 [Paralvinella palmiformis]
MEVIQDLERRIEEAEEDLQKYEKLKISEEETISECEHDTQRLELQESIDFYKATVDGLTQEIIQLKEKLFELNPERAAAIQDARQKREEEALRNEKHKALIQKHRETRQQVISEILETEKDYLHSISLCFEAFFHTDVFKCPSIDVETLLGNMNEVCDVSQMLLTRLESATSGKHFEEQLIGPCFVEVKDEMKRVYAPYCRNHDDVLALLTKYEKDPDIQACFNQMIEFMREKMSVFDLGSVLIKPIQRILKYPLLLNELLKSTEDDHPDKAHLIQAIDSMTDVAAMINEYKRRKDLVLKYKNTADVKFREKMAKLTMHSTKKKLQRFSQMVVGIQLTCQTQEVLANDISDYYSEQSSVQDVEQFCKVHSQIGSKIYYKFKEEVEVNVITPLNRLLAMFQGPVKVIKKRYDKLLDYDNLSSRVKNLRDSEQQLHSMAKNNYEALNAQLLDELPQLYNLSLDVIYECIGYLVMAQKQFYNSSLEEMYQMLGLQLVLGNDVSNIIETFNICHTTVVEQLSDVCFIPKSFNPLIDERRTIIKETKETDPMGNKEHWFVDTGDTKGFVMKHLLSPCKVGATSELPLPELLAPQGAAASPIVSENLMDLISLQPELSPSSFGGPEVSFDKQESDSFYGADRSEMLVVGYPDSVITETNNRTDSMVNISHQDDSHSRSDLEVDLTEGEPVYVIEFHDQDGNNEWWLVETNGRRGYAPANYLYKINNN